MIIGLLALIASQVMFMEAPSYWLLCFARVLQGIRLVSSLPLLNFLTVHVAQRLCGSSPLHYCTCNPTRLYFRASRFIDAIQSQKNKSAVSPRCPVAIGSVLQLNIEQFGLAMMGLTVGCVHGYSCRSSSAKQFLSLTMGPPLGGLLFEKLGFRAPFILSIAFAFVDLIGRLLIIERAEAIKWPEKEKQPEVSQRPLQGEDVITNVPPVQTVASAGRAPQLSVIQVVIALCRNRRAVTAFVQTFCYGCVALNPRLSEALTGCLDSH